MSADNWADCPRCEKNREGAVEQFAAKVAYAYGKVPVDEFDEMRASLDRIRKGMPDPTFREDYEIYGAADGVVKVRYSGHCVECGLSLTFEHDHPLDVEGKS
jgi:hypothetical protein